MLGIEAEGQVFRDRFLIVDVHMKSEFPAERWFWFDPPFHPGQSALLHRQADDVWRVDFQLGWDADPEVERRHERILPRLRAMLGEKTEFDIEWASVYVPVPADAALPPRPHAVRGDAAHLVSPFGARGADSGFQDADNLVWKLKLVMDGRAPERLLGSYDDERVAAADENILNSTRDRLHHAQEHRVAHVPRRGARAREAPRVRAQAGERGRLSLPYVYRGSPLNTPDRAGERFAGAMAPGTPAADAPVGGPGSPWLLDYLHNGFTLLTFGDAVPTEIAAAFARDPIPCRVVQVGGRLADGRVAVRDKGLLADRYDGSPGRATFCGPTSTSARAGGARCRRSARRDPPRDVQRLGVDLQDVVSVTGESPASVIPAKAGIHTWSPPFCQASDS
jgi:3-(3-hydroxy-phenyl)propionate hydroxylase